MSGLNQKVLNAIQDYKLIPDMDSGAKRLVLVGVSGGPDSVCLLHVLNQLKESLGVSLHVVHFNHMLRGRASDEDALYVAGLCSSLGITVTVSKGDVDAYRKNRRLSMEEAARLLRYDCYAKTAKSMGACCIALGHTQNDQVETILMHLIRGAGVTGIRGMQPATDWHSTDGTVFKVIRPLLEITRLEIEEYCDENDIKPRCDTSNYSVDYMRNRIRHELLPSLRSYNKNIDATLLRAAKAATADISYIESEVCGIWGDIVQEQPNGMLINTEKLLSCHPAVQKHLLRRAVERILGDLADIYTVHIEKMVEALSKPAGKSLHLPRGLRFYVGYNMCLLGSGEHEICPYPELNTECRLNIPGYIECCGWRVNAAINEPGEKRSSGFAACLDIHKSGIDLVLRSRKTGDRFQPLGMDTVKKLQDFMVDAKIPRSWRDRIPLVCSPDGILWVVGWRTAEWAKVTDATKQVLMLEFEQI
jgi:tRNA(Ile)-lysidine synthase